MKLKIIRDLSGQPYLLRWTLLSLFGWKVRLHVFLKSDEDRALHNHRWNFITIILYGGYFEHTVDGKFWRKPGYIGRGKIDYYHRVELPRYPEDHEDSPNQEKPAVTLFITSPLKRETWYFSCPNGEKDFRDFEKENGC